MENWKVYKITGPTNKVYIGITSRKPEIRWSNGKGYSDVKNNHFYRAIQKYGWENFKHEVLFENLSKQEACKKEQRLIQQYQANNPEFGYNLSLGGESGSYGYKHTPEQNKAKSERQTGRKRPPMTEETKQKISKTKTGVKMGKRPKEWTEKILSKTRGRKRTPEQIERIKLGRDKAGRNQSQETRQKISETLKSMIIVHKNNKNTRIKKEQLQEYLDNGYEIGQIITEEKKEKIRQTLLSKNKKGDIL